MKGCQGMPKGTRAATGTVPFGKRLERMLVWMLNCCIQLIAIQ